jgi:acetyl-CoA carboxylase biotin carboxyl carrier protein
MNPQDLKDLQQLIEFLKEAQVAEFDLDRGDLKVRLKFAQAAAPAADIAELARLLAATPAPAPAAAPTAQKPAPAAAPAPATDPDSGLHIVKSPIVGTFYGSPSPGASAFVSPGDRVDKGQVICIVEAMKLMNEIESDAAGEIVKVFVEPGHPVEFGQPLFAVK